MKVKVREVNGGDILLTSIGPLDVHDVLYHPSGEVLFFEVSHLDGDPEPDIMAKPDDLVKVVV